MKIIDTQVFITSLLTVSALAITVDVSAQNISASCNINHGFEHSENISLDLDTSSKYCLQDAVETIYKPVFMRQGNL